MRIPAIVSAFLLLACGHDDRARRTPAPGPSVSTTSSAATAPEGDAAARRAEWIRTVRGYVADPRTIPRLGDARGRELFERLVSETAWLGIDGDTFEREGLALVEFFPTAKAFSVALVQAKAGDESVRFKLYMDEVTRSLTAAGMQLMEAKRKVEPSQEGREQGLEKLRIGMAMNIGAILFELPSASAEVARAATERLSDPNIYTLHSAASLQLILATIDERLDAKRHRAVRDVIAKAHRDREANAGTAGAVYEGLAMWSSLDEQRVVSRGGGFAVTVGNGALVWRSSSPAPGSEHLEWRDGELLFEVICLPGVSVDAVMASLRGSGAAERPGPGPGHWLTSASAAGRDGAMRVLPIGDRTCLAGAEAPRGSATQARLDELLGSLEPAP